MSPLRLSIVVPVFDEAAILDRFLEHLRSVVPQAEIIVVDGDSSDGSRSIAARGADLVLSAPRSRALQMNAGAAAARGEVVWFLHADLRLPQHSDRAIELALADPRVNGGCFRLRFPERELIYRVSDSLGNIGVEVFGFALGDHGIFCRRDAFHQLGGYRDVPILEDAELYRALRRCGRTVQLPDEVQCSPRAYKTHGPYYTTAVYLLILVLYLSGVPIRHLHRIYRWFRRPKNELNRTIELAHAAG